MADPDAIEHLESEIVDDASGGQDLDSKPPVRHRMHRSAVRPFLCCGSELSLVSLMDSRELGATPSESLALSSSTSMITSASAEKNGSTCRRPRKRSDKLQQNKSKKKFWSLRGKFGSGRFVGTHSRNDSSRQYPTSCHCATSRQRIVPCVGTVDLDIPPQHGAISGQLGAVLPGLRINRNIGVPLIDISRVNFDALYPTRDFDEIQREERAQEIQEGIEISQQCRMQHILRSGARSRSHNHGVCSHHCAMPSSRSFPVLSSHTPSSSDYEESVYEDTSVLCLQALAQHLPSVLPSLSSGTGQHPAAHSQVEYVHCLVPDLARITSCSFYWGVIDRYEAESLLENKPEGTFLLRDSAQEEFLFSVSFRRYNRSLHARIEQWNHMFSFDAHDPAVFACSSVVGLIEHYKDPDRCMFFEPMLTLPLNRASCFPLKHLCRSVICSSGNMMYDDINVLPIPASLKEYLKYYHYKQKIRVKRFDVQV